MQRIVLLLVLAAGARCQTGDVAQEAVSPAPPPPSLVEDKAETAARTTTTPDPTSCSCEEEIRDLNNILVEKDRLCVESQQKATAHCHERIQVAQEDAQEAHAALQEEIAKLHSTVVQIREQKDSIHRNYEKSVSEAYAKGWKVAETEYQSQVKAKEDLADQLKAQCRTETRRLGTVINHIRQQSEERITQCEDRYRELAASLNEGERKDQQQFERMEQQLSSAQMVYRAQLEYLSSEKARLEEENQSLRQRSSRCLQAFLDIQREEVKKGERGYSFYTIVLSIWKWTVSMVESCWSTMINLSTYVWESIFNTFLRVPWERLGQKYAQKNWPLVWDRIRFVRDMFTVHVPLLVGMAVDASNMLITEIILLIPELPEVLPTFLADLWTSSAPIRENASQLMVVAQQVVWDVASPILEAFSVQATKVWQELCRVLYRKEMDPYIQSARNEMDRIRQASAPHIDRTFNVVTKIKGDFLRALVSFNQFVTQTSTDCWTSFQRVRSSVQICKGAFAEKFSGGVRTLLLFLRVYDAPKIVLDTLEYCQEKPIAALDNIGLVLIAMLGLSFLLGKYRSQNRKPGGIPKRVRFAFRHA